MQFTLGLEAPFSLDYTLESGQVFRWERRGEWWQGVVTGGLIRIRVERDSLRCVTSSDLLDSAFLRRYFRLDEPLENVLASVPKDEVMRLAVQRFYGLRLIEQERWECLASFLLATNANIPRIRKMVASICSGFGEPFEFEGTRYYAFPRPEALAEADLADLRGLGLGYRAPFLKRVAAAVSTGKIDFTELSELEYDKSQEVLLRELLGEKVLLGVGPKVADCVLLYSCRKNEAFPIDVWIARELAKSYPKLLPRDIRSRLRSGGKARLGLKDYHRVSTTVRRYFGPYAGYAQQYLYCMARSGTPIP